MNSTPRTTSPPRPTAVDRFEQVAPVIAVRRVAGPSMLLLVGPWLLLVLLLIPPAAVLLTLLAAVALPVVAVGLVIAVVASPYLLVRAVCRHFADRRQSSERSLPSVAPTSRATQQPGLVALASPTTVRRTR